MRTTTDRRVAGARGAAALAALSLCLAGTAGTAGATAPSCDPDDGGLKLPEGFCALRVAQGVGRVRNLAVSNRGDVFAAVRSRTGGVVALRDNDGDGRADQFRHFGRGEGHGIQLTDSHLYFASSRRVVRWPWQAGQLEPKGEAETIVGGFPAQSEHPVKAIAVSGDALYVSVGAPSNSCQQRNRQARSPGQDPCPQLEQHAGVWKYEAALPDQEHTPGARFATGMRHTLALGFEPAYGHLYAAINGRDLLGAHWGYSDEDNAELPAEEFGKVREGDDYGWPYCYHDGRAQKKVLAPEYGGDGQTQKRCAQKTAPAVAFPGHWAPMALVFYRGKQFPSRYRDGAFVAFRGSWNRAPLPQEGFRVVFVPFRKGVPAGEFETFAESAGAKQDLRATGLAVGPDGSLFVAADQSETVWRILREDAPAPVGGD